MSIVEFSLSKNEVLGKIPFINQVGLNNLCESKRIKRKKILGVWKYDKYSVNEFLKTFNIGDYYNYSETNKLIKSYGIKDDYRYYGKSNNKIKCVYKRKNTQFPLSVKNFIEYGYLKVDKDISPILITKESVIETIKLFKVFGLNNKLYTITPKSKTPKITKKKISPSKRNTTKPLPNENVSVSINNWDYYIQMLDGLIKQSS